MDEREGGEDAYLELLVMFGGPGAAGAAHGAPVEGHLREVLHRDALAAEAAHLALLEEHLGAFGDGDKHLVWAVVDVHGVEALEYAEALALEMPLAPKLYIVVPSDSRHAVVPRSVAHGTHSDR